MSFKYFSQDADADFREKHVNDSIVRSIDRDEYKLITSTLLFLSFGKWLICCYTHHHDRRI